jgi:cytochrome c peroxidase
MSKTPTPGFPPYLQDGTAATFPETVRLMARYQQGRQPATENISSLVRFLDSLTSEAGERVDLAHTR